MFCHTHICVVEILWNILSSVPCFWDDFVLCLLVHWRQAPSLSRRRSHRWRQTSIALRKRHHITQRRSRMWKLYHQSYPNLPRACQTLYLYDARGQKSSKWNKTKTLPVIDPISSLTVTDRREDVSHLLVSRSIFRDICSECDNRLQIIRYELRTRTLAWNSS